MYPNICPTCGAKPFQRCRTLSTGRSTDTHQARLDGRWPDWCEQHDNWVTACEGEMHGQVVTTGTDQ